MKKTLIALLLSSVATLALTLGEIPNEITLANKNGGLVDGKAWNSKMLKGKVHLLLYVDPDKQSENEDFIDRLHEKKYDKSNYGSIAIINLKATWLPNFAIEKKLETQQKIFPDTLYVKDKTKHLVQEWGLADNSSNIVIFNKKGEVIYIYSGFIDKKEASTIFTLIENRLK